MKLTFTSVFFLLFSLAATAQSSVTLRGVVKTAEGAPLNKATILLFETGRGDTLRTVSNAKGAFAFQNVRSGKVNVLISFVGFKKFQDEFDFASQTGEVNVADIIMTPGDNLLETVTVATSRVQIKEDTVSYVVDSTMYRKNDNVEQVIKNLPGVQVDKDGKITAQGKEVTKVKVNGKEFFGGDVKTATRELNADMVDRIQIIDDYGDQSAFTGVKDGDPTKTLNIQLKKDKNKGYFGNVTAGAGTEGRYLGSLSFNRFNGNEQISLTGNINNANTNTFNFSNLPGGMGAIAGGMMRTFGAGGGNLGSSFFGGSNEGVGVSKSLGINYRNDFSTRLSVYGSYSVSQRDVLVLNDIDQKLTDNSRTGGLTKFENVVDRPVTDNHRASLNVEYKIDSFNYVKFNPNFSFRRVRDNYNSTYRYLDSSSKLNNSGYNSDLNKSETPNFNGTVLFNHRFAKKGRTLSLNLSGGNNTTDLEDVITTALTYPIFNTINQYITQDNDNYNYGISASFNEQLNKKRSLEFSYAYNKRFTGNDKEVYDIFGNVYTAVDSLSNLYENIYTTNRFGANFRTTEKKYNYTIGLAVQPAMIESNSITTKQTNIVQHIVNYYPVVRFAYNFSRSRSLNINYNGITNQPTYQQSQPVPDFSNRQNIIIGNPSLRPEFTNTFSSRYNNFDLVSGNVFFGNVSFSFTDDKIVTDTRQLFAPGPGGTPLLIGQETRYLNTGGFYTANAFYTLSKPYQNRKYVFTLGGNVLYNNNVAFINSERNRGRNWVATQRVSGDLKVKKWLETSAGVNFTINDAKYSLTDNANSSIRTYGITHSSRVFLPKDIIISYDIDKMYNSGYTDFVIANPFIVNATIEKQLFLKKNASVKFQAFDLLKENTNVSRTVTGVYITDTRTNRLQRYFLLSFVYRLNKFAGAQRGAQQPNMMMMPQGGGMRF